MSLRDQAIGLFVFFPVLTTITVGLRIFVRTKINKGAFGMDDVALVITYVSSNSVTISNKAGFVFFCNNKILTFFFFYLYR